MPSAALCPKCNTLPEVNTKKVGLKYLCSIHCGRLGCKYYYPIVCTAFSKEKAINKAVKRWNEWVRGKEIE